MAHLVAALKGRFTADWTTLNMREDVEWRAAQLNCLTTTDSPTTSVSESFLGNILALHETGTATERIAIETWIKKWFRELMRETREE